MQIPGYQIERELGQGGMAIVYLALQESLHRHVALKVIKPVLTTDEEFAQRFMREGRIIAQLSDPHIVTVYDIASHEGTYYLSMEYLPGGSLQQRIRNGLPLDEALLIAQTIVNALHYAHRRSIIHRDIKPQNILFRENGQPVLTDFGIAKTLGANSVMTRTGLALGTPRYMSPEQIRGEGVDARADLYSFGVLLYEMLTGSVPYNADDSFALAMMHVTAPVPELPPHLSRFQPLLNKLLEKKAEARFQSGAEVMAALAANGPSQIDAFDLLDVTSSVPVRPIPVNIPSKRPGWKIALPAAALVGATLAGGYWFLNPPVPTTSEPPTLTTPAPPAVAPPPVATAPTPAPPPPDPQAQEREQQARLQAEQFLEQAQRAQQEGALSMSLIHIEQGLQAMPNHSGLLGLKQELLRQQADLQRQQQANLRQVEAGQQAKAEQLKAEQLKAEAEQRQRKAEQLKAEQLKAEAEQRQRKADEWLARALDDQRNRSYESSLLRIDQGLQYMPDHRRLLALREEVRRQLREARTVPPPPIPAIQPPVDEAAKTAALLHQCEAHLQANRLTSGKGGNATDCYNQVLKREGGHPEALAGLDRVADRYAEQAADALHRNEIKAARNALGQVAKINPSHPQLPTLREQLALAQTPKPVNPSAKPAPEHEPDVKPPARTEESELAEKPQPKAPPPPPGTKAIDTPPIDLVSLPQPAEHSAATPETQVVAKDRHTQISRTKTDGDVSLQITTSPQGMLDDNSRAAVKKQAPAGTPAQLMVRADVEDAEIWINNRKVGTTPMQIEIRPGSYRVRVRQDGHVDWNGKVDLAPGDESSITAVLPRKIETASTTPAQEHRRSGTAPVTESPQEEEKPARAAKARPTPESTEEEEKSAPASEGPATKNPAQSTNCISGSCDNGRGTYRYPDGSQYSGDFRNAKMHGQGTYVYAGRGEKYVGEWRNGVINGQGTYYYRSGNRYDGEWRNGRKQGQGTYIYAGRGEKYVGSFANDQPNGQGVHYYSGGDRYEGEWRNGRKHGQGVLYENGQRIVGEWQNDQKVRVEVEQ